jgi:hypothetical protein
MKKLIVLLLIITFMGMNCATYEREEDINLEPGQKPGAKLVIQKKDGQQVKGELIAVKKNSLLLKESGTEVDASVDIKDVSVITIVKKSKTSMGAALGLSTGVLIGAINYSANKKNSWGESFEATWTWFGLTILGLLLGAGMGASAGKDKTIQIEGKTEKEIEITLEELRKKARVPNFQ